MPKLELVISQNTEVVKTVSKDMNMQGSFTVKSLEEFQQLVNATITAIIDESGCNQGDIEDLSEDNSEDEEYAIPATPKKRRQ